MRRAIIPALLLVLLSVVLGATVFREQVAHAAATLMVREQNIDAQGNIKVHEQGTANVNVTNTSPVPVSDDVLTKTLGALRGTAASGSFDFDVSSVREVRLLVRQHSCSSPPVTHVTVRLLADSSSPVATTSVIADSFDVPCSFDGETRLYEMPGQRMSVSYTGGTGAVDFIAVGRAN